MRTLFVVWLLFILAGCTPEPVYQGRPLWLWRQELKHRDVTARCRAAAVFAVVRPPVREAIPDLIECLRDSEQAVRTEAAVALGHMGPLAKDAVPALTKLLNDPALRVRDAADAALKKIASEEPERSGPP
jgi:HEAT repeat protein